MDTHDNQHDVVGSTAKSGGGRVGQGAAVGNGPRQRMLAAMVELVGEQGYADTTVAEVIARAGASRRTFYKYFADRSECLLVAADEIAVRWQDQTKSAVEGAVAQEEDPVEAFVEAFFQDALAHPADLRLLTVELAAVGSSGIERRAQVVAELGGTLRIAFAAGSESSDGGDTGDSLLSTALVGAIMRLLYRRALRGPRVRRPRRSEVLDLIPDVAHWANSYRQVLDDEIPLPSGASPPIGGRAPGTLSLDLDTDERRGLSRGDSTLSRSLLVHNQRERLLDAIANLSAAKGYQSVTIPDIVTEAGVSIQTFYEHFADRHDALRVAFGVGHRKALALAHRAYQASEADWDTAASGAISTMLAFLAAEPSFAHLALVDVPAAGRKLAPLALEGPLAYTEMLKPGLNRRVAGQPPPQIAPEASANVMYELCYMLAAAKRTGDLVAMTNLVKHVVLIPFAAG